MFENPYLKITQHKQSLVIYLNYAAFLELYTKSRFLDFIIYFT